VAVQIDHRQHKAILPHHGKIAGVSFGSQFTYELNLPARINLLGNPGDANEGAFATISAAVSLFAGARLEPCEQIELLIEPPPGSGERLQRFQARRDELPLPYNGELNLLKGGLNRLFAYSPELRARLAQQGVRLTCWSEVPRQSGLGGSTLFVLLALAGLRAFYQLDARFHNDYILAELAQRVEEQELGITCGFADRYMPLFGGIAYLDYHGKLLHGELGQEPLASLERLDAWGSELPLAAITTGVQHDSGDVHGRMRPRYLEEHAAWLERGGEPPPLVSLMQRAWECAWRGKLALLYGDLERFGALMNENHRLVNEMMRRCGFADGAGWANNLCIGVALENGALGAKLTGAGGGGSVFALVRPGEEARLLDAWQRAAQAAGLSQAQIYIPKICSHGLQVQRRAQSSP
jgi:galactokinase/mevalonate kinase-like predicted kinase